jgi:hypothetical protein
MKNQLLLSQEKNIPNTKKNYHANRLILSTNGSLFCRGRQDADKGKKSSESFFSNLCCNHRKEPAPVNPDGRPDRLRLFFDSRIFHHLF